MSISKFYQDDQIWRVVDNLLSIFEKKQVGGGYFTTTSTPDKRYKSGKRETRNWISSYYRERTSPERRAFIKQLITDISNNKNLTIVEGLGYLQFFVYMRYPFLRNKAQRAIRKVVIERYKDLPSKREELKEFKQHYNSYEYVGWIVRLCFFFGINKDCGAYEYYKRINSL